MRNSFENLASALSKTEEDKKILRGIEEIKDAQKREKELLIFVKERLRSQPNWLLIYDNMEIATFADIKDWLPQDSIVWGRGKVVITTRDATLKNTNYIVENDIINVEMLNASEALSLFSKIYYGSEYHHLSSTERERTQTFLKNIPPFPLDVSTTAHYIKETGLSFEKYLERAKSSGESFDKSQESMLKEVGDYIKTRYGIITLTLKRLVEQNHDYRDLFFLISLVDSQNIPTDLLKEYKGNEIAEKFLRNLKKNSFITSESIEKRFFL